MCRLTNFSVKVRDTGCGLDKLLILAHSEAGLEKRFKPFTPVEVLKTAGIMLERRHRIGRKLFDRPPLFLTHGHVEAAQYAVDKLPLKGEKLGNPSFDQFRSKQAAGFHVNDVGFDSELLVFLDVAAEQDPVHLGEATQSAGG